MSYPVPVTTSLSDMVFNVTFLNVITPIFITLFGFAIVFRLLDYRNPNARTLGDTVYYSFVTMATVGYGDIAPLSRVGRSLTVFLMMFGAFLKRAHPILPLLLLTRLGRSLQERSL